ncbi:putative fungal specific transcription factor [Lyophyllum shimeji]|uniref:Fungal specific transcription factor n=1 Tax=Lyophyllum shimeji TaxID=47721 RepID=A0A9P3PIV4_LYOSH|nr:putative fungal specific transcription factor [Lyophyllum shimeji]
MPRVSQSSSDRTSSSDPLAQGPHPNVLKRNQACHQCRRRKLKCDAKRPCSTLPPRPECTFDEVAETNNAVADGPKSRYEKLESRITELEGLLAQKDAVLAAAARELASRKAGFPSVDARLLTPHITPTGLKTTDPSPEFHSLTNSAISSPAGSSHYTNGLTVTQTSDQDQPRFPAQLAFTSASALSGHTKRPASEHSFGLDIMWPNWPPNLPGPELLRHLVEVFFVFHPHANRLFHGPSFMGTLSLPPSHPKFPSAPVLHAISAIGSLYTAVVTSPPLPDFNEYPPDEIFLQRQRIKERRVDSFAEQQAKYARETADHLNSLGEDLFQVLQANIILTWFYWSHSRWVDVFLFSAHSMRLSVPLGLNMCPPFHSISNSERPPSILPPARNVIEDEMRRNAFWLAYATERQHGCSNGWAISLDDQDVSQLLPVRGDDFEHGILVPPQDRQWAHTRDLLLLHPENQTDSFILYIKGTIMISRVKTFNLRFRARHFAGDAAVASQINDGLGPSEPVDPRGSPAFIELDHIVSSFRASFPAHMRNPIVDNIVDNHLYTAFLMPHVATIVLHDPHADVRQSGCISALKILTAARAILDLIYSVWSTSFDISLLDSFCSFCWFVAGRVLVRFLQAALDAKSADQISTLRAELEFVQSAIAKVGQRIPLAFRFSRLLGDLVLKKCGPPSGIPAQITFPRPLELAVVQAMFRESYRQESPTTLHEGLHEPGSFLSLA